MYERRGRGLVSSKYEWTKSIMRMGSGGSNSRPLNRWWMTYAMAMVMMMW